MVIWVYVAVEITYRDTQYLGQSHKITCIDFPVPSLILCDC